MAKFKSVIVACLLILMSVLFVACGQTQIESISFKEKNICMTVGDSYTLELEYAPQDAELEIEYSISDNTVVYVVPNTNTIMALKAGSAVVYAKTQNGKTASINIKVVETKQNLTTPSNLQLDRQNNKLTWIAVPAAYQYQVEIFFNDNTITKVVSNNYLDISEIENLVLEPGKVVTFKVKAIASNLSAYQNSNWSDVLTFDELTSVENLAYDLSSGAITFEYQLAKQISNGMGIYFQINITGAENKTIRILKNETGVYSQSYRPTKAGEYNISVVAMMSGKTTSIAKIIKLNKLEKVTFEQNKSNIISKWKDGEKDYKINLSVTIGETSQKLTSQSEALTANIALTSDKTATLTSYVEKINKEEIVNGVKTYYINSDVSAISLGKALTPTNLQVEKISDTSVKLVWVYGGNSYKVYLDDELVECEQKIVTKNSIQYVEVVLDNLNAAGEYQFQVVSQKENTNTYIYLDSDAANFKKIVKFDAAKIKFNSELRSIEYELKSNQVGGNIELIIQNGSTTNITENISALTGSVEISVASVGQYAIEIKITKSADDAIYLFAEPQIVTITKLSAVDYETELSTNHDEMAVTFVKKSNASGYKILLNGEEISTLLEGENIYRTRIDDITINNKNYGKFTLKNINAAGKYVLNIVALGSDDEENNTYILNSNDNNYEFYKLASPTLNYNKVDSKIINFSWNVINGSNVTYEIKVVKVATGEMIYNMPVSTTSHNITFDNEGEYLVTVVAKSSKNNYLKSNINVETCNATIIKLNMFHDVKHEVKTDSFTNERLSVISVDKINNANGYILILEKILNGSSTEIALYNSFEYNEDKVVFNLGSVDAVFADAGQYNFKIYATSSEKNILQSEIVGYRVNKMSSPENVSIEYNEDSTILKFTTIDSQNKFKISIDGSEYIEINQNYFDISNLNAGSHEFKIINLGNDKNILNSNITTITLKILIRLGAPSNIQISVDPSDDSKILVAFDRVESASYYEIVIAQSEVDKTITYRPTTIQNQYVVEINRLEFCEGLQNLTIIAKPADDSEQYEMSFASSKIYIEKSAAVDKVLLSEDGKLNLNEKQARINGLIYSNLLTDVPELSSGEKITFVVRNISSIIDDFDSANKFYLAGEWTQIELTRLTTPNVNLVGNNVEIEYVREGVDYDLILTLDYLGINNSTVIKSFAFNLSNELGENAKSFNIKEFITNFVTLTNLVGDYNLSVFAKSLSNENLKLFISSKNSIENNYKYIENIDNKNTIINQENSGKINLKLNKNYLEKLTKIYFEIIQNSDKCIFEINLENNLINLIKNELNPVEINLLKNISENEIEYSIDIYKLINAGEFSINWSLKGDEEYYISPSTFEIENITKLNKPEFNYVADILGNKIVLTNSTISAMPNATFVAIYGDQKLEFSKTSEGVYLYLPYEWTTLDNIKIYALTTESGFVNSDEVVVSFNRANAVQDLHLTENESTDKTYIEWVSSAAEFIVYISQDNFVTQNVYTTTSTRFEISEDMLKAGNVKIRVVVKGYTTSTEIYLNSDFVELVCEKLDNQTIITNPNGVLTWNVFAQESLLKQYRINIGGNLYNIDTSVHTFDLKDLAGYITLNFKLVGDPAQNIISSNYQIVYVYKFSKPNSFRIQNGKFIINENLENIDINLDYLDFLININSNSFLYSDYVNYSDEMVEKFYQLLVSNSGLVSANYVVQTGTVVNKDGKKYLAINSDKTDEKSFGIYQIDIENDEFYLTQTKLISGVIETYFNWEWNDETFASEGSVRIILKPRFTTSNEIFENGWKTIKTKSGEVAAYYIDATFNNITNSGNYVSSSVCLKLPSSLEAAAYTIQVQKTSLKGEINLSSQNVDVLNFTKLLKPAMVIKNGKIVWTQDGNAAYYQMLYVNSGVSTWSENLFNGNYEPNSLFESLTTQNKFSFKMIAFGNVPELKPTENLSALSKEYVIASDFSEGEFTKLRQPGDLVLLNGVLYWNKTNAYDYYKVENVDSKIELRFYDLSMNELTSVIVPAKALINDNSIKFIDEYLTDAQKNVLKVSGKIIVKYRQLGSTFSNYVNSEFKNLKIEGAQSTIIDGEVLNYFEFLNRAMGISLTEANGLTFTGITYDNSLISNIYYDVYFVLGKGNSAVTILATTLENSTNIIFSEFKNLLKAKDPTAIISQIFVVARGNNTYYLSSLQSAIKNVYTIKGEATMIIENGIIKWENIENAGSYQIKSVIDDEEFIYEIKYLNNKFTINGVETKAVYFETQSTGKIMWCFNIAAYDGIADAEHSLNIRYMPTNQGSDVFAIPGEWTANAIRVYKISKPNVDLEKGVFVWENVTNAESFRITIKDNNGNEILTYTSSATSYVLDLNELAVKLGTTIEQVMNEISTYQVTFQSVGPNASVNGVYFISSVEVVRTGLTLKANTVNNIMIDQDTLTWQDNSDSNEYIIYITGMCNGVKVLKTITTTEKSYDLSLAKLNGDDDKANYCVTIKIAGDDVELASAESKQIEFKVLKSISAISLNKGYVNFEVQEGATSYTVTFEIAAFVYNYTIEKIGNNYQITRVTQISNGKISALNKDVETDMYYENGRIYLWPVNVTMYTSATVSVKANGYVKEETTYISSFAKTYGTVIFKPDTSKATRGKVTYDSKLGQTTFSWTTGVSFSFEINIKLYKVVNGVRTEISLNNAEIKNNRLILNEKLEKGEYEVVIQIVPQEDNYYLKSEWKTLKFSFAG